MTQITASEKMQKFQSAFNRYADKKIAEGQADVKKLSIRFYSAMRSKFADSEFCPFPCYLVDGYKKTK